MATVVITGSARGLGFGIAREFLSRGHRVVISDLNQGAVDAAVFRLKAESKTDVLGAVCNTVDRTQVQQLWDLCSARFGRVDFWINNAGVAATRHTFHDIPEDLIHAMVQANIVGTINGSQIALRGMRKQGGGAIYNVIGGPFRGKYLAPNMSVYGATKSAIFLITRYLAEENKDIPLVVGGLLPGVVATENVLEQARLLPPEVWAYRRKTMNILTDHVETICPFLVEQMLRNRRSGKLIAWSSATKVALRFMAAQMGFRREIYSRYGL